MDLQQLTHDYLAQTITDDEFAYLVSRLHESENARELFLRQVALHGQITSHFKIQAVNQFQSDFNTFGRVSASCSQEELDDDFVAMLKRSDAILHSMELDDQQRTLSFRKALSLGCFAVMELVRNPQVIKSAFAAAAVLVVGVLLLAVFSGPSESPSSDDFASPPALPRVELVPVVATLTATHNAQWGDTQAERALARGSKLHPNQRLTLTTGFAEITTNRGAIAIIEAPATIELIDHNNALRLHTGKLVGICETDSSKGFLVRTPHMDITDLGTEFGVIVDEEKGTLAHVFTGSVQIVETSETRAQHAALLLKAGQSAAASTSDGLALRPEAVAAFMPKVDLSNETLPVSARYTESVKRLNPLIYHRFEQRIGDQYRNEMGDDFALTCFGEVVSEGTSDKHAAVLTGSYMRIQQTLPALTGGDYTIEFWARHDLDTASLAVAFPVEGGRAWNGTVVLGPNMRFEHRAEPSGRRGSGDTIVPGVGSNAGQWQHVVAVRSGQEIRLYVNAVRVGTAASPRPFSVAPYLAVDMLKDAGTSEISLGRIDELAVYAHALTDSQIRNHFQLVAGNDSDLPLISTIIPARRGE